MKILYVYKYLTLGGVETVLKARLDGLANHGVTAEAWFLCDGPGRVIFEGMEGRVHTGSVRELAVMLKKRKFDLLVTIDTEEVFCPAVMRGTHRRWVVEFHTPYAEDQTYLSQLNEEKTLAVLVPSRYQAQAACHLLDTAVPIHVIPNPLRPGFTAGLRSVPVIEEPVVGWVGRMDALKNWKGFLHLAAQVRSRQPGVQFWLIGDSPTGGVENELFHLARKLGVLQKLHWFRGVDHKYIPGFLDVIRSSGGAVVSTSLGESFGMTIAEAMARGCAVVVPDASPFCEFVRHGVSGLHYSSQDTAGAVENVVRLLHDSTLRERMGSRARVRILERHRPEAAVEKLADLLFLLDQKEGEKHQPRPLSSVFARIN